MYQLLEHAIELKKYKFVKIFYACISEHSTTKKLGKSGNLFSFLSDAIKAEKKDENNELDGYEVIQVFGDYVIDSLTGDHKLELLRQSIKNSDGRIFKSLIDKGLHKELKAQNVPELLRGAIDCNKFAGFEPLLTSYGTPLEYGQEMGRNIVIIL